MSCTTGPAPPTRRPCNDLSSIDIIVIGKRYSGKSTLIRNMKLDLQRHKGGPMRVKGGGYALVQLLWSIPEITLRYYEAQSLSDVRHGLYEGCYSCEPPMNGRHQYAVIRVGSRGTRYDDELETPQSDPMCVCIARHRCPKGDTTWFNSAAKRMWCDRVQPPDYMQLRDDRIYPTA